jgi:hypothetical protein
MLVIDVQRSVHLRRWPERERICFSIMDNAFGVFVVLRFAQREPSPSNLDGD